jgi:hypothetical protein
MPEHIVGHPPEGIEAPVSTLVIGTYLTGYQSSPNPQI